MMWKEIAEFTKKDINPIVKVVLMFIPIVNIYMIYTLYKEINEMEAMVGIPEGDRLNPIVNLILTCIAGIGMIFAQNHMNAVWKKA
jgi:membrane protein insertase Oxa1/YidC/SpoIIIJ